MSTSDKDTILNSDLDSDINSDKELKETMEIIKENNMPNIED